jgi:hypothetical protein
MICWPICNRSSRRSRQSRNEQTPSLPDARPRSDRFRCGGRESDFLAVRYIRYADGSEELYDELADPLEYTNLAGKPEHAARKAELAKWLPKTDAPDLPRGGGAEGEEPRKTRKTQKNK